MGYSHWSDDAFQQQQDHRRSSGQTAFTYDAWVRATARPGFTAKWLPLA